MIAKSMSRAAGPPVRKALPDPTNKPAPMEPPLTKGSAVDLQNGQKRIVASVRERVLKSTFI